MTKKIDSLQKSIINRKQFSYSKKSVSLNFNLRVDNSSELKAFKACMEQGIKDIDEIMKNMKN